MAREGLMDDCGYNFDVDEDSYNSGFKDGFLMAVDEFAEEAEKQLIDFDTENGFISIGVCLDIISKVAEQLKEE